MLLQKVRYGPGRKKLSRVHQRKMESVAKNRKVKQEVKEEKRKKMEASKKGRSKKPGRNGMKTIKRMTGTIRGGDWRC